jgi:hypothetical protein
MPAAGRTPRTGELKPLSVKRPFIHTIINIASFWVKEKGNEQGTLWLKTRGPSSGQTQNSIQYEEA